jgi:hypothetical protein
MIEELLRDSRQYPLLFCWKGGIDRTVLDDWTSSISHSVHPDVLDVWQLVGGGDIFETETILSPAPDDELESVLPVSEFHWRRGLRSDALVFHIGICITAMTGSPLSIVSYSPETYIEQAIFPDVDTWYRIILRSEYQIRYGLLPL